MHRLHCTLFLVLLVACSRADISSASSDATLPDFAAPAWRVQHDFDQIDAVRELSDGRLLVLEKSGIVLLGPDGSLLRRIGRKGGGPGEYGRPSALLARAADTTWVVDAELRRFLVLAPSGEPVRTDTIPAMLELMNLQSDSLGSMVFDRMRIGKDPLAGGIQSTFRLRANAAVPESLFALRQTPTANSIDKERGMLLFRMMPFAPKDAWALHADGAISVAYAEPFHVEWLLSDGRRVVGPETSYPRVAVPQAARDKEKDFSLPSNKPPFQFDWSRTDTAGRFWLVQQNGEGDSLRSWWAFDRGGNRTIEMRVPESLVPRTFGRRGIYVVQYDEDDLPWLALYPWRSK